MREILVYDDYEIHKLGAGGGTEYEEVTTEKATSIYVTDVAKPKGKLVPFGRTTQNELSGKNKLNIKDYMNSSSNGLKFVYNDDGSFSVSGTASAGWSAVRNATNEVIEAGTYTFSIKQALPFRIYLGMTYEDDSTQNIIILAGDTFKTFTTTKKVKQYSVILSNVQVDTTYEEVIFAQLESGLTATNFEQYCGRNTKPFIKLSSKY